MTSRRIKFGIFAFLLLGILLVCGFMVGREILSRQKENKDFEQLVKLVTMENLDSISTPTESPAVTEQPEATVAPAPENGEEPQEQRRDLSELFAMNDDFVGWLYIPDTDINYPVMHTTDDPERYLRRNFHGEYSESGVPFLDFRCTLDSDNLIIYGHNMMNGTMFAGLRGYVLSIRCLPWYRSKVTMTGTSLWTLVPRKISTRLLEILQAGLCSRLSICLNMDGSF